MRGLELWTSAQPLRDNGGHVENPRNEQGTTHEGPRTIHEGTTHDGEVASESDAEVERFPWDNDYCGDEQLLYNLIREGDQQQLDTRGEQQHDISERSSQARN